MAARGRALRLVDATGRAYWLEYRAAIGRDGWLACPRTGPGLQAGVLLRLAATGQNTSLLLDPTPSRAAQWSSDWSTALPVGVPIPVGRGAFTVTVREATAGGARVDVGAGPLVPPAVAARSACRHPGDRRDRR